MLVIETLCSVIIDRGLEIYCLHALPPQPPLDFSQQAAANLLALAMRCDIDRDYVTKLARLDTADYESDDFICVFGHQGSASARPHVELKLKTRISDVPAKRFVVDSIQLLEVGGFVIANFHPGW